MSASVSDTAERKLFVVEDEEASLLSSPDVWPGSVVAAGHSRFTEEDRPHPPVARAALTRPLARAKRALGRLLREALTREAARGTAFCFVPVLLIAGACTYFFAPAEAPLWLLGVLSALPLAALLALNGRSRLRLACAALFCLALGALLAKAETIAAGTQMLGSEVSTRLTGRIVSIDHLANGRLRLLIDVLSTERPKLRYAPERVRVSARKVPAEVEAGAIVNGVVRLMPPAGPVRPGGYDFSFESYFDGIGAVGFFLTNPAVVDSIRPPSASGHALAVVENARDALAERIRERIGGAEGEIAAALIAGVRAGIPEEVNESLRRTGLAHILSISGLHMALVAAWIMGAMRFGFACFQNFAARHPVRKYAAGAALLALGAYLFVSGNQVAAQRSFIMISIMLVAILFDRAALTMRNLALAAILIMVLSPHEAVGPSFQMSFGATAALIAAYAAWAERRRHAPRPAGMRIAPHTLRVAVLYIGGLAMTSLLAGAATAVFGAYHFQRVSPLGLVANLAAMPIVSLLVMPFALLGVLLMPFGLDWMAFAVMGWGLRLVMAISEWFSVRSPLDAIGMIAPEAAILLSIALVLACLLTTWLRVAALPFALAGLALCAVPPRPAIFVSEDGRLVAVHGEDGALHVNRKRPNGFAIENWQRAVTAHTIHKPIMANEGGQDLWEVVLPHTAGFRCDGTTCLARSDAGTVLTTPDTELAGRACGRADLIVLQDATVEGICKETPTLVVTLRDLARRGSAMIFVEGRDPSGTAFAAINRDDADRRTRSAGDAAASALVDPESRQSPDAPAYVVRFAVREPYRPWHEHMRYSREARGLAPWTRERKVKAGEESSKAPAAALPRAGPR